MASLTIRNLEDEVKTALRIRAAGHGHSMEEEAREILRSAVRTAPPRDLGAAIRARFAAIGFVDLPEISRTGGERDLPIFE